MSVQEALKLLRFELGLTQRDLAKKVDRAYITISRWENGKGFPSRANAKEILKVARDGHASAECISYLEEVLIPNSKRSYSATDLGFPDIEREFLFQLADDSMNALYVIEAGTYKLLYANRKAERNAIRLISEKGTPIHERKLTDQADKRCFHYFGERNEPCEFCPLSRLQPTGFTDEVISLPNSGRTLLFHARQTVLKGKTAYAVYLTDITEADSERLALYELTNDIPTGVGIYHFYIDGRIELGFMNRYLYKMFDEERRAVLRDCGVTDLCLVQPDDKPQLMEEIKRSIAEKRELSIDLHMKLEDGEYHMIHIGGRMIRRDKDKFTYYCTFTDIDEKAPEEK